MTEKLKGIAASEGIAIAPAYLLVEPDLSFSKSKVTDLEAEVARFKEAIDESTKELEAVRDQAKKN
ncbi:MAG: phosphoenolpyruvate--protein phosphotransferase, partial [Lactobacillus iners]|nr:phosphoenolpyruvate--protein phosphotransferase [Lactobacillus iners]